MHNDVCEAFLQLKERACRVPVVLELEVGSHAACASRTARIFIEPEHHRRHVTDLNGQHHQQCNGLLKACSSAQDGLLSAIDLLKSGTYRSCGRCSEEDRWDQQY